MRGSYPLGVFCWSGGEEPPEPDPYLLDDPPEPEPTSVCDCPACPCAVPVAANFQVCRDCEAGKHYDWTTGERSPEPPLLTGGPWG